MQIQTNFRTDSCPLNIRYIIFLSKAYRLRISLPGKFLIGAKVKN